MIQYERIDISEEIDFNKANKSVECMICHYWYFKDAGFKYFVSKIFLITTVIVNVMILV